MPFAPRGRVSRLVGALACAIAFALCCVAAWRDSFPPLGTDLALEVTFPPGRPGAGEPLLATGVAGDGDVLAVRYLDADTAVLVYDAWGMGGPTSPPFPLRSGERQRLEVTMPSLPALPPRKYRDHRPLRVALAGTELLRADVSFHGRAPHALYFGTNPLGGTIAGAVFRGTLARPEGGRLAGGPDALFTWRERLPWLVRGRVAGFAGDLLLAAAAGLLAARLARLRLRPAPVPVFPLHARAPHRWFALATVGSALVFAAVVTGGTFRLIYPESFGNFYDHQARSLLDGRLDVEEAALSGEAFIFEGKVYGYFGPTPALLRLPFVLANVGFGQLSRAYMVAYFVAALAAAYVLLIHVTRLAAGATAWPSAFNVVVLTTLTGLGSTVLFLASRAYIYHEAILCGVMFALWAAYFALRFLAQPPGGWWLASLACGLAAVHSRPPVGLFALSILGCTALALTWRQFKSSGGLRGTLRPLAIAVAAGLAVLSFNGLSYLKFRSFDGAPLRYHVQYSPERLANIEGRNFHLGNLRYNAGSYLWRPDFELRRTFPYYFVSGETPLHFPSARIDVAEPITGLPYSMPALFLLAVAGGAFAARRWPAAREPLAVIACAVVPMGAALFAAAAVSQRYTGDFCPFLLVMSAFGLTALELLPARAARGARWAAGTLTLLSVVITIAITLHYQGEGVWGVPEDVKARYQALRSAVDAWFGVTRP